MSNLTIETMKLVKSMKKIITGWEDDNETLKESYESETDAKKMAKLVNPIWKMTNQILENKAIIKAIEGQMIIQQQ